MRKLISKPEIKIFLLAFAAQIAAFFTLYYMAGAGGSGFPEISGDANAYRILTENLVNHGVFSVSPEAPFFPESFRSPGYPFFLAPLYFIFRNWTAILFIQGILASILPVLLYLLGKRVNERAPLETRSLTGRAAFVSAMIFIFEPTRLFLANTLLTDPLFTLFFFLSLLLFVSIERSWKRSFVSGALLGTAALIRPIAIFLPVVFLPFLIFGSPTSKAVTLIKLSAFFLAGFILIIFPWSFRNKLIFNSWQLSSVVSSNLANYNVTEFLKYKSDPRKEEALAELRKLDEGTDPLEAHSLYRIEDMNNFSKKYIAEDPVGYLKFHLVKTVPFFVTDGLRDISRALNFSSASPPNLSTLIAQGRWRDVSGFIKSGGADFILFILGFSFWLLTSIFASALIVREIFSKNPARLLILFFAVLILYFAVLTGPVSNARYRLPVSGLMIFLAAHYILKLRMPFLSFRAKRGI